MLENELNIINQAQKGNSECFGLLYDHYFSQIYRFIFLKVSSKVEAQDLSHDVFLSAWKNIDDFDHQGFPFSSWLYQIARHKVIDHYRTKKINLAIENVDEDYFKVNSAVESELDKNTDMKMVRRGIRQLGEDQQNVLIMRFVEDLSYQEIARALQKSEGAIRLIQHRAIQGLKKIVKNENRQHDRFI